MWAARCQICGLWPARTICASCTDRFPPGGHRCATCALPLPADAPGGPCGACLRNPPALAGCVAAVDYAYPWSGLLRRFKFGDEPGWARPFAALMKGTPQARCLLDNTDVAAPIPLTRTRLALRGYDQSWELVKALGVRRAVPDVLLKLDDLPAQHELNRPQRLRNALRAFAVQPEKLERWQGRHILLVDDVMTTGATLNAAAQLLLQHGARQVSALVLARTPP